MAATRPLALVTGGSSGIGLELSRLLARRGHDLIIVAHNAARLESTARAVTTETGVRVVTMARDLRDAGAARELAAELDRQELRVDVLINNAGFGLRGTFAELSLADQLAMIQLNVVTLTELTGLLLPGMLGRRSGRILNVASTAAFQAGPLMAVYYATKAYVLSFSEALSNETQGSGVTVTAVCPGPTESGFQGRAGMTHTRLFRAGVMNASTVASAAYDGMMRGKRVVIPGVRNRLGALIVRLVPRAMAASVVRSLQEDDGPS